MQRSMSNSGVGCQSDAMISKIVAKVQKLLIESQNSFLGINNHFRIVLQEKEDMEVVLRRATLNRDDKMSFYEHAVAEVQKVKIALEQSQRYIDN